MNTLQMGHQTSPKTQEKEMSNMEREYEELIPTLPRAKGWTEGNMYEYEDGWYPARMIKEVISCQKHFEAGDGDVILATFPKSGTTWLKAIMFTLLNRAKHPPLSPNHPLLTHNPHEVVSHLEAPGVYRLTSSSSSSSPRMFATHLPFSSLPKSVRSNSSCKIVYVCRDPKDVLVSLWIFTNKMRPQEHGKNSIEECFEMFCKGVNLFGTVWDHILQYWKQRKENPQRVMFLTYESMKEQPEVHIRRLAEFLGCPFSAEEEDSGLPDQILKLCSFQSLRNMEVNKNGRLQSAGVENNTLFRRGEIGDWKNHLSAEMASRLDQITRHNFSASGLFI